MYYKINDCVPEVQGHSPKAISSQMSLPNEGTIQTLTDLPLPEG